MDREFLHDFWPSRASPFTGPAKLTVEEIEDAGLLEIVQTPAAGFGHWRILSQLLASGSPFVSGSRSANRARSRWPCLASSAGSSRVRT